MPKYDPEAKQPQFAVLRGDFRFEIVAVAKKISTGPKTSGSDKHELTLQFFEDAEFTKPLAKFCNQSTTLIDHESTGWKYSLVAKCIGLPLAPGADITPDDSWLGFRGWACCIPEADKTTPGKEWNAVKVFYTDKPKIAPREIVRGEDGEDVPF